MNERERLVELFKEANEKVVEYIRQNDHMDYIPKPEELWGVKADHLLANGVIVLPCKVGDTVYKISRNKVKKCEVVFVGISADEKCSHFNFVENYADGTFHKSYSMVFDVIGKTVFLTREEAEAALAERNDK